MPRRLSAALNWWIDGVSGAASAAIDRLQGRDRPLLVASDGHDGWTVFDPDGMPAGRIGPLVDGEPQPLPEAIAKLMEGRRIDVQLAAARFFRADLPPVPAESAEFLAAIVEHRVDRLAPWRRVDRLTGYVANTAADGQLAVTVAATARMFVAPVLAAAETASAGELVVVAHPEQPGAAAIVVRLPSARIRSLRLRKTVSIGLAAAVVAILGLNGFLIAEAVSLDRELPELQQRIDERMAVLRKAKGSEPVAGGDIDPIDAQKQQSAVAVVVLEVLSKVLPDDTSLTGMRVEDGHVKISGVTHSLPRLVSLLVATPFFSDATFTDPSERLEDGSDRFALDLAIRPNSTANLP